jgi:hypothetical protein
VEAFLADLRAYLAAKFPDRKFVVAMNLPRESDMEYYLDPLARLSQYIDRLVVKSRTGRYGRALRGILQSRFNPLRDLSRLRPLDGRQRIIPGITSDPAMNENNEWIYGFGLKGDLRDRDPRVLAYAALVQFGLGILSAAESGRDGFAAGEPLKKDLLRQLPLLAGYEIKLGRDLFTLEGRGGTVSLDEVQSFLTEYMAARVTKTAA